MFAVLSASRCSDSRRQALFSARRGNIPPKERIENYQMIIVVGSGPAGVAAAAALLRGGSTVTMLNAGVDIEPERRVILDKLRGQAPPDWDPSSIDFIKTGMKPSARGVPRKLSYGSDFPFQAADEYLNLAGPATINTAASFACGGFSNVWGAAIMPYSSSDIAGWPIGIDDLAPHYRDVLAFMRMSAPAMIWNRCFHYTPTNSTHSNQAVRRTNLSPTCRKTAKN